jgi:hypothetical protein
MVQKQLLKRKVRSTNNRLSAVGYAIRDPSYDGVCLLMMHPPPTRFNASQPQTDVNSKNMACNGPPNPTSPSSKIISVTAGSNVSAIWRHTLECELENSVDELEIDAVHSRSKRCDGPRPQSKRNPSGLLLRNTDYYRDRRWHT